MEKHIDYKVKNGKLLRIRIKLEKGIIKDIKITGDFFIYPEESIFEIEKVLKGINIKNVKDVLDKTIKSKKIRVIGFGSKDVVKALQSLE